MRITKISIFTLLFSILIFEQAKGADPLSEKFNILKSGTFNKYKKSSGGWRFGAGAGYALYVGNQMDYTLTLGYGEFNELRTNYTLGAFKAFSNHNEWGIVVKNGYFGTLKSLNTQGLECYFNEIQIMYQRSLNNNVGLTSGFLTCNLQCGLGAMQYKSRYFLVNTQTKSIERVLSSLGYGSTTGAKDIPGEKIALLGNLGINLGFKLSPNISIYYENSLQVALTNQLSGNLFKKSLIPPDAYYYMGLSVYLRFGGYANRIGCPKF
ncbi:MAG: hypothetical protein H7296_15485 [Bacteroidia bacterium]|nr:hypothetical protein [Bacteroidia bacterium]